VALWSRTPAPVLVKLRLHQGPPASHGHLGQFNHRGKCPEPETRLPAQGTLFAKVGSIPGAPLGAQESRPDLSHGRSG